MTDRCAVTGAGRCTPALGEPVLGPPGYTYRASARFNPIGRMTHHWWDSTHVAFGVVTVGLHNQRWKVETSAFHGREPDDNRVDLDLGSFDSFAARISFLPTERLALQVSGARLREAWTDFPFPDQDPATRIAASALYHVPLGTTASGQPRWQLSESRARISRRPPSHARCTYVMFIWVVQPLVNDGRSSKLRAPCAPCERPRVNTAQSL